MSIPMIEPRMQLLLAGREILAQASAHHDRAMEMFDRLEPDEGELVFACVGEELDFGDWATGDDLRALERAAAEPERAHVDSRVDPRVKTPAESIDLRELAGDDEPGRWMPMVRRVVAEGPIGFDELVARSGLRRVQVWMALLLGDFELVPGVDFYGAELMVRLSRRIANPVASSGE
jgi:hypothetical protein